MKGIYLKNAGEKSAILMIPNPVGFDAQFVYVRRSFVEGLAEGEEVTIPQGFKVVDWKEVETKTGKVVMLKTLGLL